MINKTGSIDGQNSLPAGKRAALKKWSRRPELTHHEDDDGNVTLDLTDETKRHQARQATRKSTINYIETTRSARELTIEERVQYLEAVLGIDHSAPADDNGEKT